MRTTRQLEFSSQAATRLREWWGRRACLLDLGTYCVLLVVLGAAIPSPAQNFPPPRWLEPTADALDGIKECGKSIAKSAPDISSKLLDAQSELTRGLLKGGYTAGGQGYRGGNYHRDDNWVTFAPPKEYVVDLSQEATWCVEVANVLNTQPDKKEAARQVLASIANDLHIKVVDCKTWGAGRLITVIANTVKNGQPDAGWTVMYKWVSVSGLNSSELSFPQISTPTSKALPPGMYSVYATRQVGGTLEKTQPVTVSAFQDAKVKCEIPVP